MSLRCAFNSNENQNFHSLATVSGDNRLKVWDIQNGTLRHQYSEALHLQTDYSCIAFVSTPKAQNNLSAVGLVALGTTAGYIVVWDLQSGKQIFLL